nr:putative 28S rRNA (cytosine-C(5))-methyltransferase [Polyrhizophydium stewartii]
MHFYQKAGRILDKLSQRQGTIKGLVMKEDAKDKKLLYALICETLKYREVIDTIIDAADVNRAEKKKLPRTLLQVLVYDLLFGKGLRNAGPYKEVMLRHRSRLNAELAKIKVRRQCKNNEDLIPSHIRNAIVLPRYVRVNTIKTTVEKVMRHFADKGYSLGLPEELAASEIPYVEEALCAIGELS